MRIVTTYKSNSNGTGVIVAKGGGKQRTSKFDHALSIPANHGAAAGTLAAAHGLTFSGLTVTVEVDNGRATFEV